MLPVTLVAWALMLSISFHFFLSKASLIWKTFIDFYAYKYVPTHNNFSFRTPLTSHAMPWCHTLTTSKWRKEFSYHEDIVDTNHFIRCYIFFGIIWSHFRSWRIRAPLMPRFLYFHFFIYLLMIFVPKKLTLGRASGTRKIFFQLWKIIFIFIIYWAYVDFRWYAIRQRLAKFISFDDADIGPRVGHEKPKSMNYVDDRCNASRRLTFDYFHYHIQ